MHGVTTFLVPVLRLIAICSGKHLSAVTRYANRKEGTSTGSMGEMFDKLSACFCRGGCGAIEKGRNLRFCPWFG